MALTIKHRILSEVVSLGYIPPGVESFRLNQPKVTILLILETTYVSCYSTDTDYYKGKENGMIINATIDGAEWKKEMDRVNKILSISEYPEFLTSGSYSESALNNNKVIYSDNNVINIKNLNSYFDKTLTASNIDEINKKVGSIENQLKQIIGYERTLSNMDKYRDKVTNI
jgi:hypothetical protein